MYSFGIRNVPFSNTKNVPIANKKTVPTANMRKCPFQIRESGIFKKEKYVIFKYEKSKNVVCMYFQIRMLLIFTKNGTLYIPLLDNLFISLIELKTSLYLKEN